MARVGTKRVDDMYDYHKDIKGKRIIRLTAGVCSGKNYWIGLIAKSNPELRILVITSRKNTVLAQARKMNAGTFLDLDRLIDDEVWGLPMADSLTRVVCTNAGIEKYFKKRFCRDDARTYLWKKFDLIVLDEAHSLATDATFTDAFYTEWFIRYAVNKKSECDVIVMSGTQKPIDWLFKGKVERFVTDLDCFNECIHLEPDYVHLIPQMIVVNQMYSLWKNNQRMIYFANHRDSIAKITKELIAKGVPAEDLGFSFNNAGEVADKFPSEISEILSDKITSMNKELTTNERIPREVKILFSTSKNKEGISILDDDIKTVFAETHNKAELKQIAGRVRGNPETGTGIKYLAIIMDAKQHGSAYSTLDVMLNKYAIEGLNKALLDYRTHCESTGKTFDLDYVLKSVYDKYRSVRYDYVEGKFRLYKGRIKGNQQQMHDCKEFIDIIENYNVPCFSYSRTGWDILHQEWFPWSKIRLYSSQDEFREIARDKFREYLVSNNLLNTVIKTKQRDMVADELRKTIELYGVKCMGIKIDFKSLGPAIRKLDFKLEDKSNGVSHIITDLRESEKM
ncbi:MAG: hypothetical protein J6M22_00050 [Firmicutes bacterium]|nr:hypothetical protein [Bacillota bacterium]